jgi:tetratricopeptide (TPR) repeat protein
MRANEAASRSLLGIATTLFTQLRAIGPLTERKQEEALGKLTRRIAFTGRFLQFLEAAADLRFEPGETPLLYNTAAWPAEAMPAGWNADETSVRPSDLVLSYHGTWRGHLPEHNVATRRFLKAALWVAATSGVATAVRYLFELHRRGFALGPEQFGSAVDALLSACRSVERDEDVPRFFFGERAPATPHDLIHADFVHYSFKSRRPLPEAVLETLFDEAQEQIERARNAADYDEWVVAQAVLYGVAWVVEHTLEEHGPANLAVKSFVEQLEELRADAGSMVMRHGDDEPFRERLSTLPRALFLILTYKLGPAAAREHVLHARAPFPHALADLVFGSVPLPPPWDGVSPSLAGVFAPIMTDVRHELVRARRFTREELVATGAAPKVFASRGVHGAAEQEIILQELVGKSAQPDEENETAAASAKWASDNRELVRSVAGELHGKASLAEHQDQLMAAMRLGEEGAHEAAVSIRRLAGLYRWSPYVHFELGIALDRSGDPQAALPHMELAIALDPLNALHWQSLSVILSRLGAPYESVLASAVPELLKDLDG